MNVTCPQCEARYNLTPAQLGAKGRSLKCARCGHQWFVAPEVQGPADEDATIAAGDNSPDGEATPPVPPANTLGLDELAYVGQTPGWSRRFGRSLLVWLSTAVVVLGAGLALALYLLLSQPNGPAAGLGPAPITDPQPGNLVLSDLKRDVQQDGSLVILRFTGTVTNSGDNPATLPELRVQLLDAKGIELDFWPAEADKPSLQPGESTNWSVRFLNPQLDRIATFRAFFKTTGNKLAPAAVVSATAPAPLAESATTAPILPTGSATVPANGSGTLQD